MNLKPYCRKGNRLDVTVMRQSANHTPYIRCESIWICVTTNLRGGELYSRELARSCREPVRKSFVKQSASLPHILVYPRKLFGNRRESTVNPCMAVVIRSINPQERYSNAVARKALAVKAMLIQPRTRRAQLRFSLGSGSARTAPASISSDLYAVGSRCNASAMYTAR